MTADGREEADLHGELVGLVGALRAYVAWAADTGVEAWPVPPPVPSAPRPPRASEEGASLRGPTASMARVPPGPPGPPPPAAWAGPLPPRPPESPPLAHPGASLVGLPPGPPPRSPEVRPGTAPRSGLVGGPRPSGGPPQAEPAPGPPRPPASRRPTAPLRPDGHGPDSLALITADIGQSCNRCPRAAAREPILHGTGRAGARLLVLGGAPEVIDARASEPFAGVPGRLLTRMLRAIDVSRGDAFLSHLVKCHTLPPRPPSPEEVAACGAFLARQLRVVGPRAVLLLGAEAGALALGVPKADMSSLRRMAGALDGVPLVVTWHPAELLRAPALKAEAWQDLRRLRALLA
jgi:uracil-DNA glycosylase family 4